MRAPDALDRILAGESVDASQDVLELAELARVLQTAWREAPAPGAAAVGKSAALEAFAIAATTPGVSPITRPTRGRRLAVRLALVAALVAALPTAAWASSQDALPGELLYPMKRGFEELRLVLAGDPADEASLLLGMGTERLEEAVIAEAFGEDESATEALAGYDDAILRFNARLVQAQSQGLPVAALLAQAAELEELHEQLVGVIVGPPAVSTPPVEQITPPEPPGKGDSAAGPAAKHHGKGGKHKGKGHPGGRKHHGNQPNGAGGSNQGGGSAGGGSGSGSGGGGGGGGNAGGAPGDGKEEPPPQPEDDDDELTEDEHSQGSGKGLGHEKAIGEGHHKSAGPGHDEG